MARGQSVRYSIAQILEWADQHHELTGQWPISRSGRIHGTDTTWEAVNTALRKGIGGLPGDDSLARLLARRRKVTHTRRKRPQITEKQIIEWIQSHRQRTGEWPHRDAGPVADAPDISWQTVHRSLARGGPNLNGGTTLARFIRDRLNIWDRRGSRRLTVSLIRKWADDHYKHTGRWPVKMSGKVRNHPAESWAAIDEALRHGRRGLPGNQTLSQLLQQHVGQPYLEQLRGSRPRKPNAPPVRLVRRERETSSTRMED